jgi:hypothetical protein
MNRSHGHQLPRRDSYLPDPLNLVGVPIQPSSVAGYAVVGIVAPHLRYQLGMLPAARIVHRYTAVSEALP